MFIYIFTIILFVFGVSIIRHIHIKNTMIENNDIKEYLLSSEQNIIIDYEGFDNY